MSSRGYMMRLHTCDPACVAENHRRGLYLSYLTFLCFRTPALCSDADLLWPSDIDRPTCGDGAMRRARGVMAFDCLLRFPFVIWRFSVRDHSPRDSRSFLLQSYILPYLLELGKDDTPSLAGPNSRRRFHRAVEASPVVRKRTRKLPINHEVKRQLALYFSLCFCGLTQLAQKP